MTDNITLPRQTVQQALDALEDWWGSFPDFRSLHDKVTIAALRTALEQQQAEPVEGNTLLKAFLASAKEAGVTHLQQAEPVAWPQLSDDMEYAAQDEFHILPPRMKRLWKRMQELYTAPPQRKPLTDGEFAYVWHQETRRIMGTDKALLLRAKQITEAAHGIKEGT